MSRLRFLAVAAAALLAAGCGGATRSSVSRGRSGGPVRQLTSIDQVRSVFSAHDGTPRLLVLASPT
jgi:hypothetical protein